MPNVTDTQLKLRDAGIQMKLALRNARDEDFFRSCINSFIAGSRSITMVMEKESANHSEELLAWYKDETAKLGADPVAKFFSSQRTHTIHRGIVRPARAEIKMTGYAESWVPDDREGLKKQMRVFIPKEEGMTESPLRVGDVAHFMPGNETAIFWTFPEAAALLPDRSPGVIRLCEDYFVKMKTLVHAWLKRRAELDAAPRG